MYTEQLSQALAFAGNPVHSASQAVGTYDTGSIDLSVYKRALFIVDVGNIGTGTVDFKLQDSADNSSFADVAGGAITQITTSSKVATIECRADQTRRYVRARLTVGTAAVQAATFAIGGEAVHKPGGAGAGVGGDVAQVAQRLVL
jgi:hypothetical protein